MKRKLTIGLWVIAALVGVVALIGVFSPDSNAIDLSLYKIEKKQYKDQYIYKVTLDTLPDSANCIAIAQEITKDIDNDSTIRIVRFYATSYLGGNSPDAQVYWLRNGNPDYQLFTTSESQLNTLSDIHVDTLQNAEFLYTAIDKELKAKVSIIRDDGNFFKLYTFSDGGHLLSERLRPVETGGAKPKKFIYTAGADSGLVSIRYDSETNALIVRNEETGKDISRNKIVN